MNICKFAALMIFCSISGQMFEPDVATAAPTDQAHLDRVREVELDTTLIELRLQRRDRSERILEGDLTTLDDWFADIKRSAEFLPSLPRSTPDDLRSRRSALSSLIEEYGVFFELCAVAAVMTDDPLYGCRTSIPEFNEALSVDFLQVSELSDRATQDSLFALRSLRPRLEIQDLVRGAPIFIEIVNADRAGSMDDLSPYAASIGHRAFGSHLDDPPAEIIRLAASVLMARHGAQIDPDAPFPFEDEVMGVRRPYGRSSGPDPQFKTDRLQQAVIYVGFLDIAIDTLEAQPASSPSTAEWFPLSPSERRQALPVYRVFEAIVDENASFADMPLISFAVTEQICRLSGLDGVSQPLGEGRRKVIEAYQFGENSRFKEECQRGRRRHAIWQAGLAATAGSVEP